MKKGWTVVGGRTKDGRNYKGRLNTHSQQSDNLIKESPIFTTEELKIRFMKMEKHVGKENVFVNFLYDCIIKQVLIENQHKVILEIVCLGIGKWNKCRKSCYQLVVLVKLLQKLNFDERIQIKNECFFFFDPQLSDEEITIMQSNGGRQILNTHGRYNSTGKTFFYMIHLEEFLYKNLIESNFGNLTNLLVFGNSFRMFKNYICFKEIPVPELENSRIENSIFNDQSFHFNISTLI